MRLTNYTNYSLRVLIYLGIHKGRIVSTEEISTAYGISNNHLVKVVNNLGHHGFLKVKRGRRGGIQLARQPKEINIGEVVRVAEPDFYIAECFGPGNTCPIMSACRLKGLLGEAKDSFFKVLDGRTLADLMPTTAVEEELRRLLDRPAEDPAFPPPPLERETG